MAEYYEPSVEFDFDSIYEKEEQEDKVDYLKESIVLDALLEFIAPKRFKKNATLCRTFSLIFVCRPHYFGKPSITQVEVAEILGVTKQIFNAHVNEFRKKFGFIVSGMRHDTARAKFSKICKERAGELAEARKKARNNGS